MTTALEILATALTLDAVWLIGSMDIRGQWLMLAAQAAWFAFAVAGGHWFFAVQSVVLAGFTVRAIRKWKRAA